jgi:hypothetical protein
VLDAVLDEADRLGVPVHRISQGSGIQLLLDSEIRAMVARCNERAIECCLFVGPRGSFDIGAAVLASNGGALKGALRGARQLTQAMADIERAVDLGVRSVLVGDLGLLALLGQRRREGPARRFHHQSHRPQRPRPTRRRRPCSNSLARIRSTFLGPEHREEIGEIRAATTQPIDFYIEAPDDVGGFVRYHDIGELRARGAPVYLKFGLRNTPVFHLSGRHLEAAAIACGRERVRRAAIGLEHLVRQRPEA